MDDIVLPMDNREFFSLVDKQRKGLGNFSELIFAAHCYRFGFSVSKPLGEQKGYDLIVDTGERLVRIQVKTISGPHSVPIGFEKRYVEWATGRVKSEIVSKYTSDSFDFLVAVDRDTFEVYCIPIFDLDLRKASFSLLNVREKYAGVHHLLAESAGR